MSRVLVTNDDGFESPGLHALVEALVADGHDVFVIAPLTDMTGCGTAVGSAGPGMRIVIEHRRHERMPGAEVMVLDRGPSMCVLAGCFGAIGPPPDVVVSGINAGPNVGNIINHSGTLGAVLTAQHLGVSGLAVSLDLGQTWDWTLASEMATATLPWLSTAPRGTLVNVNVPNRPTVEIAGAQHADLIAAIGDLRFTVTDDGSAMEMGYAPLLEKGSDAALLRAGFVTVTAMSGPHALVGDGAALADRLADFVRGA